MPTSPGAQPPHVGLIRGTSFTGSSLLMEIRALSSTAASDCDGRRHLRADIAAADLRATEGAVSSRGRAGRARRLSLRVGGCGRIENR